MNVKKIVILGLTAFSIFLFTGCSKKNENMLTEQQQIDIQQKEQEIQAIVKTWEQKMTEGARLADQGKKDESKAKLDEVKKDVEKAMDLNQEIVKIVESLENMDENTKTYYVKRTEIFNLTLTVVNKMDECIQLFFQDKSQGENCLKEIPVISKQIEEKAKEIKTYLPSPSLNPENN